MLNKLSVLLTEKMLQKGSITKEDRELYVYGSFMLLSHLLYLVLICIVGLLLGCILESLVFYVAFQFIRGYAGGYHAKTESRCEILSALSLVVCIVLIRLSKSYDLQTVLFILSIISAVCITIFSPLDTPEKPLSKKERKYFRKISLVILFVIIAVILTTYILHFNALLISCCCSVILEAILILCGKIQYMRLRYHNRIVNSPENTSKINDLEK